MSTSPALFRAIEAIVLSRVGREQAVKGSEIVAVLRARGLTLSLRRVGETVQEMRRRGDAVCSQGAWGYWVAANQKEKEHTAREIRRRIAAENRTLAAFDRAASARVQVALDLDGCRP